jgi:hypothetical protein
MIETLPLLEPDSARSASTVARCQQALGRRRRRSKALATAPGTKWLAIERAVVAGVVLIYLATVLDIAISIPPLG